MRRLAGIAVAFLGSVASANSCSVLSHLPGGRPDPATFDARLLGSWECIDAEGKEAESGPAVVYAFGDREYFIRTGTPDDSEPMRGFAHAVDGTHFLNVQGLEFERVNGDWVIVRYRLDQAGTLSLRLVKFDADRPETPEALEAWLRERLDSEAHLDGLITCERSAAKP